MQFLASVHRGLASNANPLAISLSIYLASPPISELDVTKVGGLLQFWENEVKSEFGSALRQMALNILTAPCE
jgi:hypothetical protein